MQKNFYVIIDEVMKHIEENGLQQNIFDLFYAGIDRLESIKNSHKPNYKARVRVLENQKMFLEGYRYDVEKIVQHGLSLALNFRYSDRMNKEFGFHNTFFLVALRKLIEARMDNTIKNKLFVVVDEAKRFIKDDGNPVSEYIDESVELHTAYDVNYAFSTQTIGMISDVVIQNCRYLFVPYNASPQSFNEAVKLSGKHVGSKAYDQATRYKARCDEYDWLVVDTSRSTIDIVRPLPPLSLHK